VSGAAENESKPVLFPQVRAIVIGRLYVILLKPLTDSTVSQGTNHASALQLCKKVGPSPWYDEKPQKAEDPNRVKHHWDQQMFARGSRTRSQFPYVRHIDPPEQEP
jgi:hypothetical protein